MEPNLNNKFSELLNSSEKYQAMQTTELSGIREGIYLLNQEIAQLSDAYRQATEEFIKLQSPHLDINTFVTAAVGLIGVLIGSFIAYYFNKKLAESTNKARIAIQKKNLILSKLFKELLAINKSITSLPKNIFFFQLHTDVINTRETSGHYSSIYFDNFDNKEYPVASFYIWSKMKNDIRKMYVPSSIRDDLQRVEDSIISYFTSLEKSGFDVEKVQADSRISINYRTAFIRGATVEEIANENIKNYDLLGKPELKNEMEKIITKMLELPSLRDTEKNFIELTLNIATALKNLDDLIQRIINEYEYGESL